MISTRSVLGINLSDSQLSVVTMVRGRLADAFTIQQGEELVTLFKAELEARKVRTRQVRVSVPRAWAVVKEIELPPVVAGEDLAQMIAFELERHLPYPVEEALYDWKLRPAPKGSPRRVFVVAVERRVIDQVLKLADDLKLRLLSIDLAPHALLSLMEPPRKDTGVAVLHVAHGTADLVFLEGKELRLSRSVAVTGSVDQTLAREIHRSLTLLRWNGLDAIWLSGEEIGGLRSSPALSAFGATPEPPPYKRDVQQALPLLGEQLPMGSALPALGAAFSRRPQSNVLPIERRPRRPHWSHVATAACFAATIALGLGMLLAQYYVQQRDLSRFNQTLASLEGEVKVVEQLSAELDRNRKLLAKVKEIERSGFQPLSFLRELTELVPQDAWLTTLTMDTKGMELTGQATSANQLIPILENSSLLERVEFASPVTKGRDKEQFRIRAGWEQKPGDQKPGEQKPGAPPPAVRPAGRPGR